MDEHSDACILDCDSLLCTFMCAAACGKVASAAQSCVAYIETGCWPKLLSAIPGKLFCTCRGLLLAALRCCVLTALVQLGVGVLIFACALRSGAAHKRVKLEVACHKQSAGQKLLAAESITSHQPTELIGWLPFALHFIWHASDEVLWT